MRWLALAILLQPVFAQRIELPPSVPKLTGNLLVATSKSHDPDLGKSVILVIHSDVDGVIGLVLNHPVAGAKPWFGGPIPLGVRALFRSQSKPAGAQHIFADIYVTETLMDRRDARVYAGYAGWSVPQINEEIAAGLWKILPGDAKIVFDPHPDTLWQRLLR